MHEGEKEHMVVGPNAEEPKGSFWDAIRRFFKRILFHISAFIIGAILSTHVPQIHPGEAALGVYLGLICIVARGASRKPSWIVPAVSGAGAGRLADPFRYAVPVCAVLGRLAVMGTAPSGEILSHGHGMGSVFSVAHHGLLSEANPFPASCHAVLRPPRRGTGHPLGLGPQACGGTGTQAQTGTEARTSPLPG